MKKLLFFPLWLVAFLSLSHGQLPLGIDELDECVSPNMLVRSVGSDYTLMYSDCNGGFFLLYDHLSGQAYRAAARPDFTIRDMSVLNGQAYFCGQIIPTSKAFVGTFDVKEVFFNSKPINYGLLPDSAFFSIGLFVDVHNATKMALYEDGTNVYIVAVGEGVHGFTGSASHYCSTVFSAWFDGVRWRYCMDYQKICPLIFTDMAVTKKKCMAFTAVAGDSAYLLVPTLVNGCLSDLKTYALNVRVEDLQLRLVGMDGDTVTIAYQPQGAEWVEFIEVPIIYPLPGTLNVIATDPSASSPYGLDVWRLNDLRYNQVADRALLVGEMALPPTDTFDHWVVECDWSTGAVNAWNMTPYNMPFSVDEVRMAGQFVSVGMGSVGGIMFAIEDMLAPGQLVCIPQNQVLSKMSQLDINEVYTNHDVVEINGPRIIFYPPIETIWIDEKCR